MDATRRQFIRAGAAAGGGLLISFVLPGCNREPRNEKPPEAAVGAATTKAADESPGLTTAGFIRIDRQGGVTFVVHKVEMGQGTFTSIPMLIAEELEVDPAKVKLGILGAERGGTRAWRRAGGTRRRRHERLPPLWRHARRPSFGPDRRSRHHERYRRCFRRSAARRRAAEMLLRLGHDQSARQS